MAVSLVPDVVLQSYADAAPLNDFVTWTDWALARVGFRKTNVLPVAAVCRDELMLETETAIAATWGPPFDMGSLAGMVFLGRTGMAAALGHAPGQDGRQRFVVFCLPHIGIDQEGDVGQVRRPGMQRDSSACGALIALHRQLVKGQLSLAMESGDLEQSLLRQRLVADVLGKPVPSLIELTEIARKAAVTDVMALAAGLESEHPVDVAYVSGVVIHGPRGQDFVASVEGVCHIDGERVVLDY